MLCHIVSKFCRAKSDADSAYEIAAYSGPAVVNTACEGSAFLNTKTVVEKQSRVVTLSRACRIRRIELNDAASRQGGKKFALIGKGNHKVSLVSAHADWGCQSPR